MIILIGVCSLQTCAAVEKSFVDEMIFETVLFEEDPADEFLTEKHELNRMCTLEDDADVVAGLDALSGKILDLKTKSEARYGKEYVDWDVSYAGNRVLAWDWNLTLQIYLNQHFVNCTDDDLKKILRDPATWQNLQTELEQVSKGSIIPLELDFRLDKMLADLCEENIGADDPVTLRHKINVAHDYSLFGDSKTALAMSLTLLPQVEKVFGTNSPEAADFLSFIANDYEILGNYRKSNETLLKAVAVNKALHGEKNSPKLLANLVALAKLRKVAPNADPALYAAMDNAASGLSEDDLYTAGYFRVKIFNNPVQDKKRIVDLGNAGTRENNLIKVFRRDSYIKTLDILLDQSEAARDLGFYESSLTWDLLAAADGKMNLGSYHHKTLMALCSLSEDYLTMNKIDDALAMAQAAFDTSRKIYGDEHPCTIYATHTLTDVYRKLNRHAEALTLDTNAYTVSKKFFVPITAAEPFETMKALADIADDYRGLQDNPAAIKHYEEFLAKCMATNAYTTKIADVRKNLAVLYNRNGEFAKTVKLYNFLRMKDNSYSLDGLNIDGFIAGQSADVLAEALTKTGKNSDAAKIYSQGIRKFEEVRYFNIFAANDNKREWFAQTVPYYKKAATFFARNGYDAEAFRAAELCKGRTLADQYGELLATHKSGLNRDEILTLTNYRERIAAYKDTFRREFEHGSDALKLNLRWAYLDVVGDYENYSKQIVAKYPNYREALTNGRINTGVKSQKFFSGEHVKELVPPSHCYISFAFAENDVLAFVADDSGAVKSFAIAVDDNFTDNCRAYHALLEQGALSRNKFLWRLPEGNYLLTDERARPIAGADFIDGADAFDTARQDLSARLGKILLEPLTAYIADKKIWIISPDAELNTIPFETLTFNGGAVIAAKDVSYVPSLTMLELMTEAGEKNLQLPTRKELFAMGNAVYEVDGASTLRGTFDITGAHDKLINLPGTGEELARVSKIFPQNSQAVITGREASERNLKHLDDSGDLSQYKRLLFAAHGLFIPEKPEYSAIVLSLGLNDANFDGYVTVGDWLGYKLNSDLVYLSACESGRGDYQAGEGIIGIPYALTVAGNKDTVMSLWKVRDTATAEFTAAVFEKLSRGQSEVSALNDTKREFFNSTDANLNTPTVWAAFVLYGI